MGLRLPQPPSLQGTLGTYLTRLNAMLNQAFQGVPSDTQSVPFLLMTSPNGTNYKVTVSDAGVLTVGSP